MSRLLVWSSQTLISLLQTAIVYLQSSSHFCKTFLKQAWKYITMRTRLSSGHNSAENYFEKGRSTWSLSSSPSLSSLSPREKSFFAKQCFQLWSDTLLGLPCLDILLRVSSETRQVMLFSISFWVIFLSPNWPPKKQLYYHHKTSDLVQITNETINVSMVTTQICGQGYNFQM